MGRRRGRVCVCEGMEEEMGGGEVAIRTNGGVFVCVCSPYYLVHVIN